MFRCSSQSTTTLGQKRNITETVETEPCRKCQSQRHTINFLREVHLKLEQEKYQFNEEIKTLRREIEDLKHSFQAEISDHTETKKIVSEITSQDVIKQDYEKALKIAEGRCQSQRHTINFLRGVHLNLEQERDQSNEEVEILKRRFQAGISDHTDMETKHIVSEIASQSVSKEGYEEALSRRTKELQECIDNEKALNEKLRCDTVDTDKLRAAVTEDLLQTKRNLDKLQRKYNEKNDEVKHMKENVQLCKKEKEQAAECTKKAVLDFKEQKKLFKSQYNTTHDYEEVLREKERLQDFTDELQQKYNEKNAEIEGIKEEVRRYKKKETDAIRDLHNKNKQLQHTKKIVSDITLKYVTKKSYQEALKQKKELLECIVSEEKINKTLRRGAVSMKQVLGIFEQKYNDTKIEVGYLQEQNKQLEYRCAQQQEEVGRHEEAACAITEVEDYTMAPGQLTQIVLDIGPSSNANKDAKRIDDNMSIARIQMEKKVNEILTQNRLYLNKKTLIEKIDDLRRVGVSLKLISTMHEVRKVGNDCIHSNGKGYSRIYATSLMDKYKIQMSEYENTSNAS